MPDSRWRFFVGPLVTAVVGAAILLTDRFLVPVLSPAPGALMLFATLFAAYVGGLLPGLLSALLAIAVVTITLSEPGLLLAIPMGRLVRLGAYSAMLVVATTLLGYSQTRARRALMQMTAANRRLEISHVALDQVDYGVIVLDKDLRAQFMNPAVFKRTGLRERGPDEHPTYEEILRETAANAGYAVDPEKLEDFVAKRIAFVRSGNSTPIELRMAGGAVARFKCVELPDGGRMLTYTDVTDLTRQNDELRSLRAALDQIDHGVVLLDKNLQAQYMNRTIHEKGGLRERAAGEHPDYVELLREFATSGKIPVPSDRVQHYIDRSFEFVRAGSRNPIDMRLAGGAVSRFKSSVLPDGGRMLTFTDVTDLIRRNDELGTLRSALDQVEEGVQLLDRDLRTHFMNRALRAFGHIRERASDERPLFADVLREVCTSGAFIVPDGRIDDYVAARVEFIRAGKTDPVDLRLADGKILRFKCNVLPDGGRMLIYADVTEFVRNAEQLEKLATTDGLTGLYNHRHFMKLAEAEWNRFRRHGRRLSLLIFDIDFFKTFNDRYGHEVGDQVLFHIAAMSGDDRRQTDVVARIGGEEFAVLLPETGIDAAEAVAERLRQQIEASDLQSDGQNLTVTVSVGVAEAQPSMSDVGDLLKAADQALYNAKRTGRNRVVKAAVRPIVTLVSSAPLRSA